MNESILDNYKLPAHLEDIAREGVARQGLQVNHLGDGVDIMSGHQKGLAYRFFLHPEYNPIKSRESGFEEFDEMECIQFFVSSKHKPVRRIQELPPEKLRFNLRGEIVGGEYFDAYKRWKAGTKVSGLSVGKWGVCSPAVVRTLESEGIFTVEQFAEKDETWVKQIFKNRTEYLEAFERACQHVASRDALIKSKEQAEQYMVLLEENKKMAEQYMALLEENKKMKERLEALEARGSEAINKVPEIKPNAKRRGRPKKKEN